MVGGIERGEFSFYRPLPVSGQEAEAIIARQVAPRCFLVLDEEDGRDLPVAVVRVHGEREEAFTRDLLGWGPAELLNGLGGGLRVEELPPGTNGNSQAYSLSMKLRKRRRAEWAGPHWYYALFKNPVAALDLANAHALVRTRAADDSDEHSYRDGAWSYSWMREDIRRDRSNDECVPISPDEAQRLMKRLQLRGGRRP